MLQGDVSIVRRYVDNFIFQIGAPHALMSHTMNNEWVFDSGCTHHMVKDSTLFMILNKYEESRIYLVDDFSLDVVG
jgi:hypothetical protein